MAVLLNEEVDYSAKMQAIGKNKITVSRPNVGGGSFVSGQSEPEFSISCRRQNKFADLKNSYFIMDIVKTDASNCVLTGSLGALALCNRLTVETDSSTQFSKTDAFNILFGIKGCEEHSQQLLDAQYKIAYGMASQDLSGATLTASSGATTRLAIPFALCGLSHQYLPLMGQENIRIKLNLESAITACIGTGVLVAGSLTISNLYHIMDEYEIDPSDFQKFASSFPNRTLRISNTDYQYFYQDVAAADTGITFNIGLNRRNVKSVYFCFTTTGNLTTKGANSLTSRNKANITSYNTTLGGSIVGQKAVASVATSASESILEMMKVSGGILNHQPMNLSSLGSFNLAEGDALTEQAMGKFFGKIDYSSGFTNKYTMSGLDVSSGNFVLNITKGTSTAQQRLHVWAEYYNSYELPIDANGNGGVWRVFD
jgi:hypothetical protein